MKNGRNLWPQTWYPVRRSEEVRPGQVLPFQGLGQDLIVVRSPSGKVAVMAGHCTHRGASLGHGGEFRGECVRCPFHGFQYDLSGKCVAIPGVDSIPKSAVLSTHPVAETLGMIWMFNGPEPTFAPPTLEAFNVPKYFGHLGNMGTAYAFRNVRRCQMRDSICGSLDYQHGNLVHGLRAELELLEEPSPHEIIVTSNVEYLDWGPFGYRRIFGKHVRYRGHYWGPSIVYTRIMGKRNSLGHIRTCLPVNEEMTQTDMLFVSVLRKSGRPGRLAIAMRRYLGRLQDDEDTFLDHQKPRAMYVKNFDEGMIAHHRLCLRLGQRSHVGREPVLVEQGEAGAFNETAIV